MKITNREFAGSYSWFTSLDMQACGYNSSKPLGFYSTKSLSKRVTKSQTSRPSERNTQTLMSSQRKRQLREDVMFFIGSGLQYQRNTKIKHQYKVQISQQCFRQLRSVYNLNGRFRESRQLEQILNIRTANIFEENQRIEISDLRFRLANGKEISINQPFETFKSKPELVIKSIRLN